MKECTLCVILAFPDGIFVVRSYFIDIVGSL